MFIQFTGYIYVALVGFATQEHLVGLILGLYDSNDAIYIGF